MSLTLGCWCFFLFLFFFCFFFFLVIVVNENNLIYYLIVRHGFTFINMNDLFDWTDRSTSFFLSTMANL